MASEAPTHILWADVETTGLDVEKDVLLEVAVILTDAELEPQESHNWVLKNKIVMNEISSPVLQMHLDNGLLMECIGSEMHVSTWSNEFGKWLAEMWKKYELSSTEVPLAGSSVHFDRKFLTKNTTPHGQAFSKLDAYVSHRNIDVSSIRTLMKMWKPANVWESVEEPVHRAMSDLLDHIDELKHYKELL